MPQAVEQPALQSVISRLQNSISRMNKQIQELQEGLSRIHTCSTPMAAVPQEGSRDAQQTVRPATALECLNAIADEARAQCDSMDYLIRHQSELI